MRCGISVAATVEWRFAVIVHSCVILVGRAYENILEEINNIIIFL